MGEMGDLSPCEPEASVLPCATPFSRYAAAFFYPMRHPIRNNRYIPTPCSLSDVRRSVAECVAIACEMPYNGYPVADSGKNSHVIRCGNDGVYRCPYRMYRHISTENKVLNP